MARRMVKKRGDADASAGPSNSAPVTTRSLGRRVEAGFREAATAAVQEALESGVPVAMLSATNQVTWLHPGIVATPTQQHPRQRRRAKPALPQAQQHEHG